MTDYDESEQSIFAYFSANLYVTMSDFFLNARDPLTLFTFWLLGSNGFQTRFHYFGFRVGAYFKPLVIRGSDV